MTPHTPIPWRYVEQEGDAKGKFPGSIRSFYIESDSRKYMLSGEAYKTSDDPHVWEEVRSNFELVCNAVNSYQAMKAFIEDYIQEINVQVEYGGKLTEEEYGLFQQAKHALNLANGKGESR